ncbi:hypothetical protein JCM33374_g4652 [Metschnikowia sp. JCM 33374]|nr:hypothetical protein JCM33374_g4652 [Metschnikowia sp. JCM 33374]
MYLHKPAPMKKSKLFLSLFGVSSLAAAAPVGDNEKSLASAPKNWILSFLKCNKSRENVDKTVRPDGKEHSGNTSEQTSHHVTSKDNIVDDSPDVCPDVFPDECPDESPHLHFGTFSEISKEEEEGEEEEAEEIWEFYRDDHYPTVTTDTGVELRPVSGRAQRPYLNDANLTGDEDTIDILTEEWRFISETFNLEDSKDEQSLRTLLRNSSKQRNERVELKGPQHDLPTISEDAEL